LTKKNITKERDSRTHDERITALRDAFERLKVRANATGSINDCSVRKVCYKANVSDSYMYEDKFKDIEINKKYQSVKNEIKSFKKDFKKSTVQSELGLVIASKESMETERNKAHLQYRDSLKQNVGLKASLKIANDKLQAHNQLAVNISHSNLQSQSNQNKQYSIKSDPKVVSPDAYLYKNGKYSYGDKNVREAAWLTARHQFVELLKRNLSTRVYILVGAPCAGKTYWSKQLNYYNDMHTLVVDATNLTKSDRSSWFSLIYKYKNQVDIKACAVYFDTPHTVLMERNNQRPPDKRLTNEELQGKFIRLEPVDVFEDFDEIIVVRHE